MSTREENIKKINEELEAMSDDELNQVAGGSYLQLSDDSKFLYEHGLLNKYFTKTEAFFDFDVSGYNAVVDAGWKKAGITCVSKYAKGNLYFMKDTGKQISCGEARRYVMTNFKQVRMLYLDFKGY